jgi:tol-pal system protein YbgF
MKFFFKKFGLISILGMGILVGCASQSDFQTLQKDSTQTTREVFTLQRNLLDANTELKDLSAKLEALEKENRALRQAVNALNQETKSKVGLLEKEMDVGTQPMRRQQADMGARLEKLQLDVQNLTGRFEETKYFAQKTFAETKTLKETHQAKIEELEKQIVALNKAVEGKEKKVEPSGEGKPPKVGVEEEMNGKLASSPAATEGTAQKPSPSKKVEKPAKPATATAEDAYKKAYELYSKGDTEGAKKEFKAYLETYPKSKYVENAHFWLGECYFSEKKYEEAILEFDEVIKKFPKGNKVPNALFRQGMAFLELKDSTNAKLIFKEVVKRYPNSDLAKSARKKLQEL